MGSPPRLEQKHQFDYDLAGNRTWMEDATGVSTSTYDSRNLLLRQTNQDGKTVTYSYDSLGRRRTMTDSDGGRFTYSYDLAGRLIRRQSGNGAVASYTYDCADRLLCLGFASAMRPAWLLIGGRRPFFQLARTVRAPFR